MNQTLSRRWTIAVALALVALSSSCTMKSQDAPPLTGPSELGTSITVTATPDAITQDGASQALITITAYDSDGKPKRNLSVRSEIVVGGVRVDFGTLSARNLVTGNDGRTTLVYTAPIAIASQASVDQGTIVNIQVTPYGTDFANETPRIVSIRLLPVGIVLPPNGVPVPNFTFSPATATENVKIQFDASSSTDDGAIVSYRWNFGDGDSATGVNVSRAFTAAGAFNVTLTVTDDRGLSASTTKVITIGTGSNPIAAFTVSPVPAVVNGTTFFDGALSSPSSGRRIASYSWSFGDGASGTGASTTHSYTKEGTYAVTLTVTDDVGKTGVSSQTLTVGSSTDPVAAFTTSPAAPLPGQVVNFNASGSQPAPGRTIRTYAWDFGDGDAKTTSTPQTTHDYLALGTYVVTLVVTDDAGRTGTATQSVTVGTGTSPTAEFVSSPGNPLVGQLVNFNASASRATAGSSIVSYAWDFGDGSAPKSGLQTTYSYLAAGTYNVTLTVTDNIGRQGVVSHGVTILSDAPIADFIFSPRSPAASAVVNFNAATSTTAPGRTITSYFWNFGSGLTSTASTPSIVFNAAGDYDVLLIITDNAGKVGRVTKTVTVVP